MRMRKQLSWRDAIVQVLRASLERMHYAEIAEQIEEQHLRTDLGATPANTVNVIISDSLKKDGALSIFERVERGYYRLRAKPIDESLPPGEKALAQEIAQKEAKLADTDSADESAGFINAFGMYWERNRVSWDAVIPKLLGKQSASSLAVDFSGQHGVYLLYDRNVVIYVGQITSQGLGARLRQHTVDRLNGRWDRFSWFGVYAVSEKGELESKQRPLTMELLITTMEALLIESVEPVQNRRRGDNFNAVEFLQEIDPDIQKNQEQEILNNLAKRLHR